MPQVQHKQNPITDKMQELMNESSLALANHLQTLSEGIVQSTRFKRSRLMQT